MGLAGKYAIVGVGETDIKPKGIRDDVTQMSLILQACKRAIEDAGLTNKDIDGVLSAQAGPTFMYSLEIAEQLGIRPSYTTVLEVGGATPASMVQHAMMAIDAGLCKTVVCVYGEKQRTRRAIPRHLTEVLWGYEEYENPYGLHQAIAVHAMALRRHMHLYGTTSEQLGAIAVAMRRHASMNKNAQMRKPITLEDHQNSPYIVEPLRLFDICQVTDAAGAVVVTSAEHARTLRKKPVYVIGYGQFHPHRFYTGAIDLVSAGGKQSSEMAFKMAGIKPQDVDAAQLYDCFTYTVLVELEDYGFAPPGEGGAWVQGGRIEIDGELPVNTHGGLLSQGHVDGMLHITEAVKQIRGNEVEPERQVKDCELVVVSGHGGPFCTHATLILASEPSAS